MIAGSHTLEVCLSILALTACAALAAALTPELTQPALADLPPRKTAQPTPIPTPKPPAGPAAKTAPAGGAIELSLRFPQTWPWDEAHWQQAWTVVQWQDLDGDWHEVEGWRGTLDSITVDEGGAAVGRKAWWVAEDDLGTGPFRWLIYRDEGGRSLAASEPFHLPSFNKETVTVELTLGR